jgi:hypothetical protein
MASHTEFLTSLYGPWHYIPVLARKPGALHNGASFRDWVLPASMERVRRKLAGAADGDRQEALKGTAYEGWCVADVLRWKEPIKAAHEGGPRKREELLPALDVNRLPCMPNDR